MVTEVGFSIEIREWDSSGRFTRMLGQATLEDRGLLLETSGSISIAGPLGVRSKKIIPWQDLEKFGCSRKLFAPWKAKIWIRARNLSALANFPSAIGDYFEARSLSPFKELRKFTTDANLAIAEALSENLSQQIEKSSNEHRDSGSEQTPH